MASITMYIYGDIDFEDWEDWEDWKDGETVQEICTRAMYRYKDMQLGRAGGVHAP